MSLEIRRLMNLSNGNQIPAGCEIGTFTVSEVSTTATVQHNFGTVPRIAVVIGVLGKDYGDYDLPSNTSPLLVEVLGTDPADGVFDISKTSGSHVLNTLWNLNMTSQTSMQQTNTYTTYPASLTETSVTFAMGRYYNGKFIPGDTYVYVLIQ